MLPKIKIISLPKLFLAIWACRLLVYFIRLFAVTDIFQNTSVYPVHNASLFIYNLYHSMSKFSRCQIDDVLLLSPEHTLYPKETICMKCQNLFSGNYKKANILECLLLNFLARMLSAKKTGRLLLY